VQYDKDERIERQDFLGEFGFQASDALDCLITIGAAPMASGGQCAVTAYRGANGECQKECSDRLDRVLTAGRGPVRRLVRR
jgi:hypothetical protein